MSELLAPAGSWEMLQAAVRTGADAVYFGAAQFNARRTAQNFEAGELAGVVSYCHVRGVHAYLALNTLISDAQMPDALALAQAAAAAGIDGVILQDLGLAALLLQAAPQLRLHASTQLSVHTPAGLDFLAKRGFKRAVAARENSQVQLRALCAHARELGMEIEVFIHGALCMSVSGQCLLSAMLGGRSGNRGLCAGPCRLPFSVPGGTGYDLSLKDLSLLPHLHTLEQMGVASFKIEGRLKRPEYAAAAVGAARAVLNGDDPFKQMQTLEKVFSRSGFTDGYFTGHPDAQMFGVRRPEDVANSRQALTAIHELYRTEHARVAIRMQLTLSPGRPALLTVNDGVYTISVTGPDAQVYDHPPTVEQLRQKLTRCGGTPYDVESCAIEQRSGAGIPGGALTALRRQALTLLSEKRGLPHPIPYTPPTLQPPANRTARTPAIYLFVRQIRQLPKNTDAVALAVLPLFAPDRDYQAALATDIPIAAKTPPALFGRQQQVAKRLQQLQALGVSAGVAENIGAIPLIRNAGMQVIGGARLNCFNSYTPPALDADRLILSCELEQQQLKQLQTQQPCGIFAYGKLPLMLLQNCPSKAFGSCESCGHAITDRKGHMFPLWCEDGAAQLYNDRPVDLSDRQALLRLFDFIVLSFTDESPQQVDAVLRRYQTGQPPQPPFTRGLYFRGVL